MVRVIFDGTIEGFLCIIHAYYYEKIVPLYIQTDDDCQQTLDVEEYYVSTDFDKALRVQQGIRTKISAQAEHYMFRAFLAECGYMDLFRYLVFGFKVGAKVDNYLQEDCVLNVYKKVMYVSREAHLLSGFCRFSDTKQGVFYCEISPVNNVLPILAEHFQDRMMNQAWIIHDKKRNRAAVYDGSRYVITDVPEEVTVQYGENEELIQDLWQAFFDSVTIKERINKKLQRNLLPLHFRKHMTEFKG